jgi:hypothetical protein
MTTFTRSLTIFLTITAFRTSESLAQGWTRQQSGTTQNLYGVAYVDPDNGIVVGQGEPFCAPSTAAQPGRARKV